MPYINLLLALIFCFPCFAGRDLPELVTKQSVNNIRYISLDGKFTYYKRRSGQLMVSSNFDSLKIVDGSPTDDYRVQIGPAKKLITFEKIQSFYMNHNMRSDNEIYISQKDGTQTEKIGMGTSPQLHQSDRWLSYFSTYEQVLNLQSLFIKDKKYQIKLANKVNPYFQPEVLFLSEEEILYTDINAVGEQSIIFFNLVNKNSKVLLPPLKKGIKIELCQSNDSLFIGEFPQVAGLKHSRIVRLAKKDYQTPEKMEELYISKQPDTGNLICNIKKNKVHFIKEIASKDFGKTQNVAELDVQSKKIKPITSFRIVTQMINMDGRLIVPYYGKYYVAVGPTKNKSDYLKEDSRAGEKNDIEK